MVDTLDSKSGRGDPVSVRVRPQVPRPYFNTFLKLSKIAKIFTKILKTKFQSQKSNKRF